MRIQLKIAALLALLFLTVYSCKKSGRIVCCDGLHDEMAGMRTWQSTQVNMNKDSTGTPHYDTVTRTFRTQIVPLNGGTILFYHDSAARYPDTLVYKPSNATGITSFTKMVIDSTGSMSTTSRYDSVAYNAAANSIVWYEYTEQAFSQVWAWQKIIAHTP